MKGKSCWILVADGTRARILRHARGMADSQPPADLVFEAEHKRPGRVLSDQQRHSSSASIDTRRTGSEASRDQEREAEARFAEKLVKILDQHLTQGDFQRLAIIAEPRMLGLLRQKLSPALRPHLAHEIARDLTTVPRRELEAAIAQLGVR